MLMRAREEACFFEPIFASTSGSSINEEEAARIEKGWPDYLKWIDQSTEKEITA